MFLNRFVIYIISSGNKIEEALRDTSEPEDSSFEIKTVSSAEGLGVLPAFGSAVIVDCVAVKDIPETNAEFTVLLASAEKLPDTETLSRADDLWIMPDSDVYGAKLLKISFERLMSAMKRSADSRRLETCFITAIDSIPDLVWFKDRTGAHLIVNNSFCKAVEKTKEQIYKKGHYYIWDIPKEEYEQGDYVCLESEDDVIAARKTCLFDEKVKTKSGMRQFKTYKSPLIDKDGSIFGTCGVAHDVTDIQNTNNELDVVLESMPYAVVVSGRQNTVISTNSKFGRYFPEDGSIIGMQIDKWRKKVLKGHTVNADGDIEITRMTDGELRTFVFNEEPIVDIFDVPIGTLNIFRDVTLERQFEQQTIRSANTDFLTGLHNRRSLFSYLETVREEQQLSMITIDLDNFKMVNDKFGHQKGDEALIETAKLLEKCFPNDFIVRLGGDEFLVVICGTICAEELERQTANLLDTLCGFFKSFEEFSMMTASAGIAYKVIQSGRHDIENLMINSDSALYRSKNTGKAKLSIYG